MYKTKKTKAIKCGDHPRRYHHTQKERTVQRTRHAYRAEKYG
jgi:ribosomal protein L24E